MASKKNSSLAKNNSSKNNGHISKKYKKNMGIIKVLIFLGIIVFGIALIYLMNYFFVEKSDLQVNISTDKQLVYMTIDGKEELVTTQKYVSDLDYSMRYDIYGFKVYKYKTKDIYKSLDDERVMLMIEKSTLPTTCVNTDLDTTYSNCYVEIDDFTENYYISTNEVTYKITLKTPSDYEVNIQDRIKNMLSSFTINS